jgi:hypothetical protein
MSYYTAPLSAYTLADNSKQAARATPKGSLSMLCAGDAENAKQPGILLAHQRKKHLRISS